MASPELLQLARAQFGAVHRRQLVNDLGMSRHQVSGLLRRGAMSQILPETYHLASHPDTFLMRAMATQMWADDVGFLSSWSAGRVYGLPKMASNPIHYTAPHRFARSTPRWIHLDRTRWFDPSADRTRLPTGLTVATPHRTLFGLAADINDFRFARAAEDAWHRQLISPPDVAEYLEEHRCRGKNGVARIERWLHRSEHRRRPAQSSLEMCFIDAFDKIGLPLAQRQHPLMLESGELIHLDIAWPDIQMAVEPGSSWCHGGDRGQARDHGRDLGCNELGWLVIRLDETFAADPSAAAQRVARAHRRRRTEIGAPATETASSG